MVLTSLVGLAGVALARPAVPDAAGEAPAAVRGRLPGPATRPGPRGDRHARVPAPALVAAAAGSTLAGLVDARARMHPARPPVQPGAPGRLRRAGGSQPPPRAGSCRVRGRTRRPGRPALGEPDRVPRGRARRGAARRGRRHPEHPGDVRGARRVPRPRRAAPRDLLAAAPRAAGRVLTERPPLWTFGPAYEGGLAARGPAPRRRTGGAGGHRGHPLHQRHDRSRRKARVSAIAPRSRARWPRAPSSGWPRTRRSSPGPRCTTWARWTTRCARCVRRQGRAGGRVRASPTCSRCWRPNGSAGCSSCPARSGGWPRHCASRARSRSACASAASCPTSCRPPRSRS